MKLFYLFICLFNYLFGWWFHWSENRKWRAKQRRCLEMYRQAVGEYINCLNSVRPLQPTTLSFWPIRWKSEELSILEERERLGQIFFNFFMAVDDEQEILAQMDAEMKWRQRQLLIAMFLENYCQEWLADSGWDDDGMEFTWDDHIVPHTYLPDGWCLGGEDWLDDDYDDDWDLDSGCDTDDGDDSEDDDVSDDDGLFFC